MSFLGCCKPPNLKTLSPCSWLQLGIIYLSPRLLVTKWNHETSLIPRVGNPSMGSSRRYTDRSGIWIKSNTEELSMPSLGPSVGLLRIPRICVSTFAGTVYPPLSDSIRTALRDARKISTLYTHQAVAIAALSQGKNVIVSTSTASGKSVIYQVMPIVLLWHLY